MYVFFCGMLDSICHNFSGYHNIMRFLIISFCIQKPARNTAALGPLQGATHFVSSGMCGLWTSRAEPESSSDQLNWSSLFETWTLQKRPVMILGHKVLKVSSLSKIHYVWIREKLGNSKFEITYYNFISGLYPFGVE